MNDKEIDEVTIGHLGAIMIAMHVWAEKRSPAAPFPPAVGAVPKQWIVKRTPPGCLRVAVTIRNGDVTPKPARR
jgi:hypothetical protein